MVDKKEVKRREIMYKQKIRKHSVSDFKQEVCSRARNGTQMSQVQYQAQAFTTRPVLPTKRPRRVRREGVIPK